MSGFPRTVQVAKEEGGRDLCLEQAQLVSRAPKFWWEHLVSIFHTLGDPHGIGGSLVPRAMAVFKAIHVRREKCGNILG